MPGSALALSRLRGWGKVPSSSNASGCKAPPGTGTTTSRQSRAQAAPTVPAPAGSDPAPQRAPSEHPVLFAGIPHSPLTKGHPLLPPLYQPSVASPFRGSFADEPHCRSFVQNIPSSICVWFFLNKLLFNVI